MVVKIMYTVVVLHLLGIIIIIIIIIIIVRTLF
jgi:hypothetical protein